MRFLLDTHTLLWVLTASPSLSETARRAAQDSRNEKWVSVASLWEITIKSALGKLQLHEPLADLLTRLEQSGFVRLCRFRRFICCVYRVFPTIMVILLTGYSSRRHSRRI